MTVQFEKQPFTGNAKAVEGANADQFLGRFVAGVGAAQKVVQPFERFFSAEAYDPPRQIEREVFDRRETHTNETRRKK